YGDSCCVEGRSTNVRKRIATDSPGLVETSRALRVTRCTSLRAERTAFSLSIERSGRRLSTCAYGALNESTRMKWLSCSERVTDSSVGKEKELASGVTLGVRSQVR